MNQKRKERLSSITRALRYRNFRLYFAGQTVSLIGTWMQRIAVGWLVYRLTHSAFLLGVVGFSRQIPTFVLAPFAGVLADRWNRHHLLILTQVLAMVQAFVLAYLVLSGTIIIWHIVVLSLILGVVTAFDMPVRQSFMVEMIEKSALASAIGAPWTVFLGGAACLAGAGLFARRLPQLREKARPIYVTKKILPDASARIECASELSVPRK
jgi:MFS family permease